MKAVIIGGSGLIGGYLLSYLLAENSYSEIIAVTRRPLEVFKRRDRFTEVIFDFAHWDDLYMHLEKHQLTQGDAAFCSLGTTIKKAGTKEAFHKVDHDYIVDFAKSVKSLSVGKFLTVSALGADPNSTIFYNKVKGQTERDLMALGFQSLSIFRPSLLLGERGEKRFGEKLAVDLLPFYSPLLVGPLKKYHPVQAERVARSMVHHSLERTSGVHIIENEKLL